jgi:superfamily I DNA/RNA helicase
MKSTLSLSPQQQAAKGWVRTGSGNLIVRSVAGSGKTTLLVEMLPETEGEVAFCAYNKAISEEIAQRVAPLGLQSRVRTGTCHSFGFAALRAAYKNIKVDGKKLGNIAEDTIENWGIRRFCVATAAMAKQLGYQIDPAFSWDAMVNHFSLEDLLPEDVSYDDAIRETVKLVRKSNSMLSKVVDFDDMIYGPLVKNLPFRQYDWCFLDEAQDANFVRRAMMKKMLKPTGRFVAVGDEHQAIYGFTGADHASLENIATEFQATELPLTVTYRCPKKIVAKAQEWVSHIEAHESAPEGIVDSATVKKAMGKGEFGASDAILCRTTKPLIELAYKLLREGTACRVEGRAIGEGLIKLAKRWKKVTTVAQLEERLEQYEGAEMTKAQAKGNNDRCSTVEDQVGTLRVLIENCDPSDSIEVLVSNIRELFSDSEGNQRRVLTLSTIHRAKGREWDRVFALDMDRLSPSRWAKKPWELAQESNLCYVQVTRAKKHLTLLSSV